MCLFLHAPNFSSINETRITTLILKTHSSGSTGLNLNKLWISNKTASNLALSSSMWRKNHFSLISLKLCNLVENVLALKWLFYLLYKVRNNFVLTHISNLHSKRAETHARIRTKFHFLLTDLQLYWNVSANHTEIFQYQIARNSQQLFYASYTAKLTNLICKFSLRIRQNENRFVYCF